MTRHHNNNNKNILLLIIIIIEVKTVWRLIIITIVINVKHFTFVVLCSVMFVVLISTE